MQQAVSQPAFVEHGKPQLCPLIGRCDCNNLPHTFICREVKPSGCCLPEPLKATASMPEVFIDVRYRLFVASKVCQQTSIKDRAALLVLTCHALVYSPGCQNTAADSSQRAVRPISNMSSLLTRVHSLSCARCPDLLLSNLRERPVKVPAGSRCNAVPPDAQLVPTI